MAKIVALAGLIFAFAFAQPVLANDAKPNNPSRPSYGFRGSWSVGAGGRLEFSMEDGSSYFVSRAGKLKVNKIGDSDRLELRLDRAGHIAFAADPERKRVYTFIYHSDGMLAGATDADRRAIGFGYGSDKRISDIYFPNRTKQHLP